MSEGKENMPKIRFPGFTGAWEQVKLESVASFSKGHGYSKSDLRDEGTPIILYGRLYTKYETSISEVDTFVDAKSGSVYSKGGEVIIPASGETAEDIARAAIVKDAGVLLGGDLNVITPDSNVDSVFLALSISNGNPQKELAKKAQGKSVVHIHNEEIKELIISFPKQDEQKQISTYFANLDNLITLHQRKLNNVKKLKSGLLQKMFPKNGECFPEIRFPGFTDAWEQHKLKDIGEIVTGSTPSTKIKEYYSKDGIPWVTPTDISENVTLRTAKHLSKKGQKVARVVPKNTILVTSIASIGKNTMLGTTGSFNQQINGLVPNQKEQYPYFLFVASELWSKKMKNLAASGTMQIVNKTEFSELTTYVPSLEEQTQIGTFFLQLDNLITLHQRKLEHLQELKKSLLQQMFV